MKIATWNVNGIRAREAQTVEWVAREQPDVVCLQEIKAKPEQVPESLCNLGGYWCYWHGAGGYSGVGLHLAKTRFPEEPAFSHPDFDHETRIVQAVAGRPRRGVGLRSERGQGLSGEARVPDRDGALRDERACDRPPARALRRHERRPHRPRRPPEGA